ncbi:MAG: response regulator transcription factor, partial [Chloroflexota bacterium]|nr:response regulator transcription factor [Chloroflexota bacterium]
IVANQPNCKVLVITAGQNESMLQQMLDAGASGFVLKTGDGQELVQAAKAVLQGKRYLSPALLTHDSSVARPTETRLASLTAREREVLQLIGEGLSNRQIAEQLCLSVKTVEVHRDRIADKLGVRGRSLLMRFSISSGLACA